MVGEEDPANDSVRPKRHWLERMFDKLRGKK